MTRKESKLIKELGQKLGKRELRNEDLLREKEKLLDNLRYLLASLRKIEERGKKIRDNKKFLSNGKGFYRELNAGEEKTGNVPRIEKFEDFWGSIWEKKDTTPLRPWMAEIGQELHSRVDNVVEFEISEDLLIK